MPKVERASKAIIFKKPQFAKTSSMVVIKKKSTTFTTGQKEKSASKVAPKVKPKKKKAIVFKRSNAAATEAARQIEKEIVKKKTLAKKKADDVAPDDASASDSLVAIRALEEAQSRQEEARRRAPSATDQVSRFAAAHAHAAAAAERAADCSETTVERMADEARTAAAPQSSQAASVASKVASSTGEAQQRLARIAPPVAGVAADAFNGSGGRRPPMALQDNYRMFNRQVRASVRSSGDAPQAGQMGNRVADVASQLVRETNQTASSGQLPRVLSSTVSPLMDTFYRMLVHRVIDRVDIAPHLNDPQSDSMRHIRQAVRVSRRAHEERMLRLPRAGEPPCAMGDQCMGLRVQCQGGGGTLVAFYYEEEWARYEEDTRTKGAVARLPNQHRQCLLCIRYDTHRCIMSLRNDNMQFAIETGGGDQPATPVILQPHFNLVDVEGEYPSSYCWTPVLEAYEGLPYPSVKPSLLYFTRVVDTKTGDVYLRQKIPYPKLNGAITTTTTTSSFSSSSGKSGGVSVPPF